MKCKLCNYSGDFLPMGKRKNARCPNCKSLERHREFAEIAELKGFVLHISGNPGLCTYLSNQAITYHTSNIEMGGYDLEKPLPNGYDYVIMLHVLEHIEKDMIALKNVYDCLNSGGVLWLQVPFEKELREDLGHKVKFTKQGLKMKLTKAGFKTEIIKGFYKCVK